MNPPSSQSTAAPIQDTSRCLFDTLVVVGVGLIGGSVALAARQRGIVRRIIGVGRNAARLEQAREGRVLDEISVDLVAAASHADLIVFATPVDQIVTGVVEANRNSEALMTDAGSTKGRICRILDEELDQLDGSVFIGSHPLAGSEKQGWENAKADLFDGRVCVVTPTEHSPRESVTRLTDFWQALGMTIIEMSPEAHDRALAQTSHVPHVVASALARTLENANRPLAATGFSDTTRIAAGDPNVWLPILLDNRAAVLAGLDEFSAQLATIREALARNDSHEIRRLWEEGKAVREQLNLRRSID